MIETIIEKKMIWFYVDLKYFCFMSDGWRLLMSGLLSDTKFEESGTSEQIGKENTWDQVTKNWILIISGLY